MPTQPRAVPKVSALKGVSIDEYVAKKLNAEQATIVAELRAIIRKAAPKSTEAVKWAQPVFEENGPFAYIKPSKSHMTFGSGAAQNWPTRSASSPARATA